MSCHPNIKEKQIFANNNRFNETNPINVIPKKMKGES